MHTHVIVRKDSYVDSVLLMRISSELKNMPDITDAIVTMATAHNRQLLESNGYPLSGFQDANSNDLVLAIKAEENDPQAIEALVDNLLAGANASSKTDASLPTSIRAAFQECPDANLVLISVPGEHAAREAKRALLLNRHVMLFSDNVSVEDEIALKKLAKDRGLLVMGPDCGTAIINGKPLAFANVVKKGPIGIVGASGTGVQEISCCVDHFGSGISQAIGTGGRDLSDKVQGIMTLCGIDALARDPLTKVLVVVSKPPSPTVATNIVNALATSNKPSVVHFVGAEIPEKNPANVQFAHSLAEAAKRACLLAGKDEQSLPTEPDLASFADNLAKKLTKDTRLCGLFCGGTTGNEALHVLGSHSLSIFSNLHKNGSFCVDGISPPSGHVLLDLGDDVFTQGRPHPMIEPELRNERLDLEMELPNTNLFLFDVVLGFGSHMDPAGLLAKKMNKLKEKNPNALVAIASITGTSLDPQDFASQKEKLDKSGMVVMPSNHAAAELAAQVLLKLTR